MLFISCRAASVAREHPGTCGKLETGCLTCKAIVLVLLEVAAIVRRQSHSSFDREFLHQVHGITHFGLLALIRSSVLVLIVHPAFVRTEMVVASYPITVLIEDMLKNR